MVPVPLPLVDGEDGKGQPNGPPAGGLSENGLVAASPPVPRMPSVLVPASLSGRRGPYLVVYIGCGVVAVVTSKEKEAATSSDIAYCKAILSAPCVSSGHHISHHFEKLVFWGVVVQQQPSEDSRDIAHRFFVFLAASTIKRAKRPLPSPGKHNISNRHQHTHRP